MMAKFKLGQLVATRGVADLMGENPAFSVFARRSLRRFISGDWGEMCESDKRQNEDALKNRDNRIFAAYENPEHAAWKLWIITEWDHSATTLLFPSEY
jgi:hypothetical protein